MILPLVGVLFTIATTTGVVVGNASTPHLAAQWTWLEPAHLRFDSDVPAPLRARVVSVWEQERREGAPFAHGSAFGGEPVAHQGEVLVTLLQRGRRPDNLGWTNTRVDVGTHAAEWSVVELGPDSTDFVIAHELHDHVEGFGHSRRPTERQ